MASTKGSAGVRLGATTSLLMALLQGAKLQHGHMPLYVRGDEEAGRAFPSLHAVQRHMADTGRFKLAWEGNEEEYEDFYDFDAAAAPMEGGEEGSAGALACLAAFSHCLACQFLSSCAWRFACLLRGVSCRS